METSISPKVLTLFQKILSDQRQLISADSLLKEAFCLYPNFLHETCKIFILSNENKKFCFNVGVILNEILKDVWDDPSLLTPKQKKEIREIMLHGVLINAGNQKIIQIIGSIVAYFIEKDGFEMWSAPLQEFILWMNSNEMSIISTGLELFLVIIGKIETKINSIVPLMMSTLFQVFAVPELTESLREKVLILLYMTISSFAYADGVDDSVVHSCFDETYELWMSVFISTLQTSQKTFLGIKRFIVKILTVIFRDFTHYSKKSLQTALLPIWKFFNQLMPLYIMKSVHNYSLDSLDDLLRLKKNLSFDKKKKYEIFNPPEFYYLDDDFEYNDEVEGLALQTVELISTLIVKPNLYAITKIGLFPLLNVISHFLMLSDFQTKTWNIDYFQYLFEEEDETTMRAMRSMLSKLISELIEKHGEESVQVLIVLAEKMMVNYSETEVEKLASMFFDRLNFNEFRGFEIDREKMQYFFKTSSFELNDQRHSWKKKELAIFLLGSFSEDIIVFQTKYNSTFDLKTLIKSLMNIIEDEKMNQIIKARVWWTVGKFSEVLGVKNKDVFVSVFGDACKCLDDKYDMPVKLIATKTIAIFGSKIEKFKLLFENKVLQRNFENILENSAVLENLLRIIDFSGEKTLRFILESLISLSKLSPLSIQKIAFLGAPILLRVFHINHEDIINGKLLIELLKLLCSDSDSFSFIYNVFTAYILENFKKFNEILSSQIVPVSEIKTFSLIMSLMDIVCIFLSKGQQNQANESLIALLNPLINLMLINEEVTMQLHASICLKTFILTRKEQIINLNLLPEIIKIINKISHPNTNESSALYLGNIILLTFQNLANGAADMNILKSLVYKVYKSRMPSIIQGLALVFARMINLNTKETIKFLTSFSIENRIGLKVLIDKWLLHQPLFKGKLTKNSTILALSKLFLEKDKTLETLLVIGFNPSHSNINSQVCAPFKILSTLIRCLDNESQMQLYNVNNSNNESPDNSYKFPKKYEDDERLDTLGGDDPYDAGNFNDLDDEKDENMIEVDLEKFKDEDELDVEKRLNQLNDKKDKGLADLEVGSECYMTDMLDFEFDDGEECDETTEQDLIYLDDVQIQFELRDMLKQFFSNLIKNDGEYFAFCIRNLIKEDVDLIRKYIKVKINV